VKQQPPTFGRPGLAPAGDLQRVLGSVIQLIEAGRLDDALSTIRQRGLLKTPAGLAIAGDIEIRRGQPEEALKMFDAAVKLAPNAAEPYANRGAALMELGRFEEALAAEERALRIRQDYPGAHFNRANALRALGRPADAITAYTRTLTLQPGFAKAHLNRGLARIALQQWEEALADFAHAIRLLPQSAAATIGRATALRHLQRFDEALVAVDAGLRLDAGDIDGLRLKCDILYELERNEEALATAALILERLPDDTGALAEQARSFLKLSRNDEAIAAADRIASLAPDKYETYIIRAAILTELGHFEDSLVAIERARELGAPEGEYVRTRALVRSIHGDPADALADFERALATSAETRHIHRNRAHLRIILGDWPGGWDDWEWRLLDKSRRNYPFLSQIPKWNGEPLAGKRLLVYGEQGMGDQIQFVRYVPVALAQGAKVTLLVDKALRSLFARNFPDADVVSEPPDAAGFDYQISLMSMPAARRETLETLPHDTPYLAADPARIAKWRERVTSNGLRIGIIWQGNRQYPRDPFRSIPLAKFAPLSAVPGVSLYSVQAKVGLEQLDAPAGMMTVTRFGPEIEDNPDGFEEMAGLMANLDLLVMSDTGPTHLAAALGLPVWVALTRYPDWRWMREREDSPWYPNVRLFRQTTQGDWEGVFARIAAALAPMAAAA
jgi:tetratricopeptide (TPR) repeat protein